MTRATHYALDRRLQAHISRTLVGSYLTLAHQAIIVRAAPSHLYPVDLARIRAPPTSRAPPSASQSIPVILRQPQRRSRLRAQQVGSLPLAE